MNFETIKTHKEMVAFKNNFLIKLRYSTNPTQWNREMKINHYNISIVLMSIAWGALADTSEVVTPKPEQPLWLSLTFLAVMCLLLIQQVLKFFRTYFPTTEQKHGVVNSSMVCPHCHTRGSVRTKVIEKKVGIDKGKAAAGYLTAGVSLLFTGISKKGTATQAHCGACGNSWSF